MYVGLTMSLDVTYFEIENDCCPKLKAAAAGGRGPVTNATVRAVHFMKKGCVKNLPKL